MNRIRLNRRTIPKLIGRVYFGFFILGLSTATACRSQATPTPTPDLSVIVAEDIPTATPTPIPSPTLTSTPTPAITETPTPTPEPTLVIEGVFIDPPESFGEVELALPEIRFRAYPFGDGALPEVRIIRSGEAVGRSADAARMVKVLTDLFENRSPLESEENPFSGELWLQPEIVVFQNGRGVRWVESDGETGEFAVVYEGISADRRSLIRGRWPVESAGEGFRPPLADFDTMIGTIKVTLPLPPVEINADGTLPLTVFYPPAENQLLTDHSLFVSGFTQPGEITTLLITIQSETQTLVRETVFSELNGRFEAELRVPNTATGEAELVVSTAGRDVRRPILIDGDEQSDRFLSIHRDALPEVHVAGRPLFVHGRLQGGIPGESRVEITVAVDRCETVIARASVPALDQWSTPLELPDFLVGEACVTATHGTPGVDPWLTSKAELVLVDPAFPDVPSFYFGSSPQMVARPGETMRVIGFAESSMALTIESGAYTEVTRAFPDSDGVWELLLDLPESGLAEELRVTAAPVGEPDAEIELNLMVAFDNP